MSTNTRKNWRLIGLAFAGILLLIIFAQNLQQVEAQILFLKMSMPLVVMLIGTAILGYIGGVLTAGMRGRGARKDKPPLA